MLDRLNNFMRVLIIIGLIVLMFLILTELKTDCDLCEFDYGKEGTNYVDIYKAYKIKCLSTKEINYSDLNFSLDP